MALPRPYEVWAPVGRRRPAKPAGPVGVRSIERDSSLRMSFLPLRSYWSRARFGWVAFREDYINEHARYGTVRPVVGRIARPRKRSTAGFVSTQAWCTAVGLLRTAVAEQGLAPRA